MSDFKLHADKDIIIVKTDLGNRSATTANGEENIVNAIIDSCALPFLFRVWSKGAQPTIVDGGICANLPISQLKNNVDKDGPIVAVSFQDGLTNHPTDFQTFALSMLDSAISTTMVQTKSLIPANAIYELNTDKIDTFSFNVALEFLRSQEYENLVKNTERWFEIFIKDRPISNYVSPWDDSSPVAQAIMSKLGKVVKGNFGKSLIHYLSCQFKVVLNSLRDNTDQYSKTPDRAEFEYHFETRDEHIDCMIIGLVSQSKESKFDGNTLPECKVRDRYNKPIDIILIPIKGSIVYKDESGNRDLAIFYVPPLEPNSDPYTITFRENGTNLMPDLISKGQDEIGYIPQREYQTVDRIDLVLVVPTYVTIDMAPKVKLNPGTQMTDDDVRDIDLVYPNMKAIGWRGEKLKNNEWWGVKVTQIYD